MTNNIVKQNYSINKEHRREKNNHHSAVIWFTGLSGSGKSTLAQEVQYKLFEKGILTYVLDGDNIRFGLNNDLGFSSDDREENIRRIGEVSKLFVEAGVFILSAFVSPYKKDRNKVRNLLEENEFLEVYVNCPLEVCESRDVKGLYAKARKGLIKGFTGIDDPYEKPENPEITINTSEFTIEESVQSILNYLKEKKFI